MSLGDILSPIIGQESPAPELSKSPSTEQPQDSTTTKQKTLSISSAPSTDPTISTLTTTQHPQASAATHTTVSIASSFPVSPSPSSSLPPASSQTIVASTLQTTLDKPKESFHSLPSKPSSAVVEITSAQKTKTHQVASPSSATPTLTESALYGKVVTFTYTSYSTLPSQSADKQGGGSSASSVIPIVGSVIGALLLAAVIASIVVLRKRVKRKRTSDTDDLLYYQPPSSATPGSSSPRSMADANLRQEGHGQLPLPVTGHSPRMESAAKPMVAPHTYEDMNSSAVVYPQTAPYPPIGYGYSDNYSNQPYYGAESHLVPNAVHSPTDVYRHPDHPHHQVSHQHMNYSGYPYPQDTYIPAIRTDIPHSKD